MDKQVKISLAYHQILTTLAAKKNRSLKDFLEQAINYFKVTELDPKEIDSEGIKVEIKKLDRRIVSFFRTQEKEKIAPILDELSIISKTINENLTVSPSKKDFSQLAGMTKEALQKVVDSHNGLIRTTSEVRLKELSEIKMKYRRLFQEYLNEIEAKGALTSPKAINDKFKKAFDSI
jgi:ElaB/YqjD/DUF883 family membrane-anchored ribosome-binding protein